MTDKIQHVCFEMIYYTDPLTSGSYPTIKQVALMYKQLMFFDPV